MVHFIPISNYGLQFEKDSRLNLMKKKREQTNYRIVGTSPELPTC